MKTYAAYYDNKIREESSSGGLFSLIASRFDVVYGVAMTEDCYGAEFIRARDDLSALRGSKYLQARVGDTFKYVKEDLLKGKKVLFSGTGCQINGLAMFLGKEYPNLLLLDVVCHGVPSPRLWREYAEYLEKKYGKLESVNFRYKGAGGQKAGGQKAGGQMAGERQTGIKAATLYISKDQDAFMSFFLKNLSLRPSCYECHAKYYKRADLTIADFWGINEIAPEMNDGKGTSLVIARTEKGQEIFEEIKNDLSWKEVSYEDGVKYNYPEYRSVARPEQREAFYKDVNSMSFEKLVNKYVKEPLWKREGRKAKHLMKGILSIPGLTQKGQNKDEDFGMLFTFKK